MESASYDHVLALQYFVIYNCYQAPFSRLILLCLVILSKRCIFVIENPASSLIFKHYRFEWLCNKVAYVSSLLTYKLFKVCMVSFPLKSRFMLVELTTVLRSTGCHSGWDCLGASLQSEPLSGQMTYSFGDWILEYFAGVPKRNPHHAS